MARNATRPKFTPKPLDLSEPVTWVLKRAFGPPDRDVALVDADAAMEAADLLGYLPRIGQRTPRARLFSELGEANGTLVIEATHRAAAGAAALSATARFVRDVANERGLPAVFLKFSALAARGVVRPGSRVASDVDVLAGRHHGAALVAALLTAGARAVPAPRFEHELGALHSPFGTNIDVHRYVPGVRFGPQDRFVTADELLQAGLVDARTSAPTPEVLAAHALVHGFVQNAGIPQSGAAARALADLGDLERFAPLVVERALSFVQPLFDSRDASDLVTLYRALERGEIERGYAGPGAALLSHVLGSALDDQYAASLRRFLFSAPLSDRRGPRPWVERVTHVLVPTPTELSRIYGPPRGKLGVLRQRLWRPIDLVGRAFRLL